MKTNPSALSRREFVRRAAATLGAAGLGSVAGCAPRPGVPVGRRHDVPLGVQLYSVRHEAEADLPGTLSRLAGMNFQGVEFADYFGRSAAQLRALLDERGLRCCGSHIYIRDLLGAEFDRTVEFNRTLGNPYLIIRWIEEDRRDSRESFMRTAQLFNQIAARLEPHGIRLGYHNHDYIFQTFEGETLWDILAANTRDDFILQLDTGHAAGYGKDVAELIRRHPGRTASMHIKPHSAARPAAVVGEDDINWPEVVHLAETVGGIEWYILEYEIEGVPPLQALEASLAHFRGLVR
jgi:sugar phosphate isomerase/epimerase